MNQVRWDGSEVQDGNRGTMACHGHYMHPVTPGVPANSLAFAILEEHNMPAKAQLMAGNPTPHVEP